MFIWETYECITFFVEQHYLFFPFVTLQRFIPEKNSSALNLPGFPPPHCGIQRLPLKATLQKGLAAPSALGPQQQWTQLGRLCSEAERVVHLQNGVVADQEQRGHGAQSEWGKPGRDFSHSKPMNMVKDSKGCVLSKNIEGYWRYKLEKHRYNAGITVG